MVDVTTPTGWFAGAEAEDERSRRFIATVASAAAAWTSAGVAASDTSSTPAPPGAETNEIAAQVVVPGLSTERRHLWVLYDPDVNGLPSLTSQWSIRPFEFDSRDGYAYDCEPPDEEVDLWVSGVRATPDQCGAWAGAWLERQLARPVLRREWDAPTAGWSTLIPRRRPGAPALVEWTVGDPENVLDLHGDIPWDWLRRRPPTREIWERRMERHSSG